LIILLIKNPNLNAVSIVLIKEDLSYFLIIYTRFINIFSKLTLDQFLLYRPYDHKIVLELNKKELTYSPFYKINAKKLETTKIVPNVRVWDIRYGLPKRDL
jgi:hypothetical protein